MTCLTGVVSSGRSFSRANNQSILSRVYQNDCHTLYLIESWRLLRMLLIIEGMIVHRRKGSRRWMPPNKIDDFFWRSSHSTCYDQFYEPAPLTETEDIDYSHLRIIHCHQLSTYSWPLYVFAKNSLHHLFYSRIDPTLSFPFSFFQNFKVRGARFFG